MAVYTEPTKEQWQAIAVSLGYDTIQWTGESRGTSDTKYVVKLGRKGEEPVTAMLNIIETPDVNRLGSDAAQAKFLPELLDYIRANSIIYDKSGKKVSFGVPTPFQFTGTVPYLIMDFPSKGDSRATVKKAIYVVPYISGKAPLHCDNIPQAENYAFRLGQAHAAWQKAAAGFPEADKLGRTFPVERWPDYAGRLRNNPDAVKKLAARLKETYQGVGESDAYWNHQAQEHIDKIIDAVAYITANWQERTKSLPDQVINGDPFPDNSIVSEHGSLIIVDNGTAERNKNLDIAIGLNAAAMGPGGKLDMHVASAYLNGYDSVKPLTPEERRTLEFMGQAAAIRWALYRTLLIADTPAGAIVSTRVPTAPLQQYEFWHEAEKSNARIADRLLEVKNMKRMENREKAALTRGKRLG